MTEKELFEKARNMGYKITKRNDHTDNIKSYNFKKPDNHVAVVLKNKGFFFGYRPEEDDPRIHDTIDTLMEVL